MPTPDPRPPTTPDTAPPDGGDARRHQEDALDEAVEETFPCSDPACPFMPARVPAAP